MSAVKDNLARIRERIEAAARRAGRDPGTVRLVAVSKTVGAEKIREAVEAGAQVLGENYLQEAQKKIEALGPGISWHFIGHLQKNKAKYAVRLFDLIHSVDSLALAEELDRAAEKNGRIQEILLQADELKVIMEGPDDFGWAEENARQVSAGCILFLQAEWSRRETMIPAIVDYIQHHPQWRISLQSHKYMRIP